MQPNFIVKRDGNVTKAGGTNPVAAIGGVLDEPARYYKAILISWLATGELNERKANREALQRPVGWHDFSIRRTDRSRETGGSGKGYRDRCVFKSVDCEREKAQSLTCKEIARFKICGGRI